MPCIVMIHHHQQTTHQQAPHPPPVSVEYQLNFTRRETLNEEIEQSETTTTFTLHIYIYTRAHKHGYSRDNSCLINLSTQINQLSGTSALDTQVHLYTALHLAGSYVNQSHPLPLFTSSIRVTRYLCLLIQRNSIISWLTNHSGSSCPGALMVHRWVLHLCLNSSAGISHTRSYSREFLFWRISLSLISTISIKSFQFVERVLLIRQHHQDYGDDSVRVASH